ncbi:MAG TPA: hypothetical protein VFP25_07540 [Nitrososphaeraceae archaeon]|nr:hypothetical protein [Nitrososphaeraceae archaeon]
MEITSISSSLSKECLFTEMKFVLGFDGVVITYLEQHDIHCHYRYF